MPASSGRGPAGRRYSLSRESQRSRRSAPGRGFAEAAQARFYHRRWAGRLSRRSILKARTWDPLQGYGPDATYNADVYIFALVIAVEHANYEPLDASGLVFWVLSRNELVAVDHASLSLATVRRLAGEPINYGRLDAAIRMVLDSSAE